MAATSNSVQHGHSANAQQLHDVFEVFSHQSELLEESYRDLQGTVAALTFQLKREQSARLQELVKKEEIGRRLSELLETLPGAILVLDQRGVVQQQNSEASTLLNQPLIGCSWASIVAREVSDGGSEDGNIELRDGRWLSLSRRPLKTGSGEILLLADVTESRRISELRQRNERLTMIGEMTAEFAHQVRTPLASAILYAGQLETDTPKRARVAGKILTGLGDVKRMVNDMLGFAAGAKAEHARVKVADLLNDIRESIDGQLSANTSLTVSVSEADMCVAANRDAIKGALINLIMNADQASDGGGNILLHGYRYKDDIFLCVTDDGPGIPDEVQPRLFEAFFTTRPQGTGLGLSVVQAVVTAHDGAVTVDTSNLGTSFTISLPEKSPGSNSQ